MKCPYCNSFNLIVIDSRDSKDYEAVRRRRLCEDCGRRFTTYEKIEKLDLLVIKKDGRKENFTSEKIKKGLVKATWKRPVSMDQINEIVELVEKQVRQQTKKEIKSWEIGNIVIEQLKKIDELSYLLFAAVYLDFSSLEDFQQEINKLVNKYK